MRAVIAFVALLVALVALPSSAEVQVPPLHGYVVDTSGKLSAEDVAYLDAQLERDRAERGFAVVAFVVGSLDGEPIEDVAYRAFNTWGVGDREADDGVLLVIAPEERRVRIETGRGIGDRLTDLESSDIIEHTIEPLLVDGRYRSAIEQGADAISVAIDDARPAAAPPEDRPGFWSYAGIAVLLLLVFGLAIISPAVRGLLFFGFLFGGSRGGGGSSPGGGYTGGGGTSGGGGASGDY